MAKLEAENGRLKAQLCALVQAPDAQIVAQADAPDRTVREREGEPEQSSSKPKMSDSVDGKTEQSLERSQAADIREQHGAESATGEPRVPIGHAGQLLGWSDPLSYVVACACSIQRISKRQDAFWVRPCGPSTATPSNQ